jgi:hypothetical protein
MQSIATIDNHSSGYSGNVEAADLFKRAFPACGSFKIQIAALPMVPRYRFADMMLAPATTMPGGVRMSAQWKYQIRIDLDGEVAEAARFDPGSQKLKWLSSVLAKHRARLRCQFDLFAEYVAEAEKAGTEGYPLYEWTKATIENPVKKAKYVESFSLYVDDQEVYAKEIADALEADLMPLVHSALIKRLSKYDSDPANNPQPPMRTQK